MEPYYPNVKEKADFIKRVIKSEEERFHETLQEGLAILNNLLAKAKSSNNEINGSDAFKLYDTYGFPIELTEELASQENISVDMATFEKKWINNVHELEKLDKVHNQCKSKVKFLKILPLKANLSDMKLQIIRLR